MHLPLSNFRSPPYDLTKAIPHLDDSAWINKVILSEDPDESSSPQNCIFGVLYERHGWLAFMRLSDEGWTYVDPSPTYLFYDIIFYNGYLYAIQDRGKLMRIDLSIGSYVDKEEGEVIVPKSFRQQAFRAYS
ncbi:hypothetical protein CDL15_Pgr021766 [Punica granatum]|uniref:KIB1-4 beta-propeller domain-containing protein n=1 Tax=Punica granatum TaxID=22663 RepID=A0A218WTQ7_PUNGR|nr:hypothetical protein CDL15_Pgr021766 [Punica granatum]